ncbi:spermidine synthase [Agromyces sp. MMS24-K17]|uniref:spermidine synthase n=1 Tax=Agromyces sp. MMS24-K17 TaxID=3372850 RepID=UPI00375463D1
MAEPTSERHPAGLDVRLVQDRGPHGGTRLVIGGVTQSHVYPGDPRDLELEYVRIIAAIVDGSRETGHPLRILHLGAGALTLPRYFGTTRPGSVQHVVELHEDLLDLVLAALPLPDGVELTVEFADARVAVERAARTGGGYDVAVVDVFDGRVAPAHLSTLEFLERLGDLLAPDAIVVVNTLATGALDASGAVAATLRAFRPAVVGLAHPGVVDGTAIGNVVYAASTVAFPTGRILDLADRGPRPIAVLDGDDLATFIGGAAVAHDPVAVHDPAEPS